MPALTYVNFLRKYFLILYLKELSLIVEFKLAGRLFQVVGPAQDKPWIPSFLFRKGSFNFFLEERVITQFNADF